MGGGVGISLPARFRVASENTTYAMPETGIGLFPDVGGGWYLPRKPGEIGMWLALTGARLKAADCLVAGIATHFVAAAKLEELKRALICPAGAAPAGHLEQTLSRFASAAGAPKELTPDTVARIDRIFARESVEAIFAALEADGSDWARAQLATLKSKSPQTLKVTFRQLRQGARAPSFADEMRTEYRIAARVVSRHDFQEGVRAIIVDKDNKPVWNPGALDAVSDAMLDEIFAPLPAGEEWTPL
jgi:enoyl-CoA hydratase